MTMTPRVAACIELYKRVLDKPYVAGRLPRLAYRIMLLEPREREQYYAAVAANRAALAAAEEATDWA